MDYLTARLIIPKSIGDNFAHKFFKNSELPLNITFNNNLINQRLDSLNHYYSALTMWMVGLWLSALRHLRVWQEERRAGIKAEGGRIFRMLLPAILLVLVAFASGLGGIRMILICASPLVASALLWGMTGENGSDEPASFRLPLALALGMAVCCAGGYLVNSRVLANIYSFSDYSIQTISMAGVTGLEEIFRGFLTALGFTEKLELFTVQGLLSIGSAVALLIMLILSFHTIRHSKDPYARFIQIYMLMGLLCVTCVFVFLSEGQWLHCLYYLPLLFWILPALGKMEIDCPPENYRPKVRPAEEEERKPAKHGRMPAVLFPGSTGAPTRMGRILGVGDGRITAHGLLALLCCLVLIGNGVFYTGFFRDPASLSDKVVYSGLNYIDPFTVEGLQPVADYLKDEGYTLCYAAYWDAAVITELTDGKIRTVPIAEGSRRKVIQYMDWLTDTGLYDPEYCRQQKACLVIQEEMYHFIEADEDLLSNMREAASFNGYTVYELTDPAVIAEYLD